MPSKNLEKRAKYNYIPVKGNVRAEDSNMGGPVSASATPPDADIIQRSIGALGRWHVFIFIALFSVKFAVAWHQLNIVFLAPPTQDFNCSDPAFNRCSPNCPSHQFDQSIFTETIISQWDLVCDRAQLANVAQLMTMFGILIGNVIFGYLADRFGRRTPLVLSVVLQVFSGLATAFCPWFILFLVLRLICAIATGGTMVTSFVMVMELVGAKWRTSLGVIYQIPFNVGHLILAGMSYLLRDWRYLQVAISLPSIILMSYYWILPESPRWLLTVGHTEKSIEVMERIAVMNRLPTAQIREDVRKYVQMHSVNIEGEKRTGTMVDLVRTQTMKIRTLCVSSCWFICGLCFFGVAQFLGQIGGNIFVNVACSALIQIPGTLLVILIMEKWGRKITMISTLLVGGLSCVVVGFLPVTPSWPTTLFGCIGIFGLSSAFPTIYIYSGELFPTVVRNSGIGFCSMAARTGSMIAPFVASLSLYKSWLPPIVFGFMALIASLLLLKLPETLNCKLIDTLKEAEEIGDKSTGDSALDDSNDTELEYKH